MNLLVFKFLDIRKVMPYFCIKRADENETNGNTETHKSYQYEYRETDAMNLNLWKELDL